MIVKNKTYNLTGLAKPNGKLKLKYPGVMAIVMYSFILAAIIELLLAYFLYEKPTITYNFK